MFRTSTTVSDCWKNYPGGGLKRLKLEIFGVSSQFIELVHKPGPLTGPCKHGPCLAPQRDLNLEFRLCTKFAFTRRIRIRMPYEWIHIYHQQYTPVMLAYCLPLTYGSYMAFGLYIYQRKGPRFQILHQRNWNWTIPI